MPSLIIAVEGIHDAGFLRRASDLLRKSDPDVASMIDLERSRQIVILPLDGGAPVRWPMRFAPLGLREFHLYDRETDLAHEERILAARAVNDRPGCLAMLTRKRAIENYLSPAAILAAGGPAITFSDDEDVPTLLAQQFLATNNPSRNWSTLSHSRRKRIRDRAKRWLHANALPAMTADMLHDRDRDGEVRGWLETIAHMAEGAPIRRDGFSLCDTTTPHASTPH